MSTPQELGTVVWRKSSHSNGEGGSCLEVADGVDGVMPVRDSKVPDGPALVFPSRSWSAFVTAVSGGTLRRR